MKWYVVYCTADGNPDGYQRGGMVSSTGTKAAVASPDVLAAKGLAVKECDVTDLAPEEVRAGRVDARFHQWDSQTLTLVRKTPDAV